MFDNLNLDLKVDKMSPETYRKIGPMWELWNSFIKIES